MENQDETLTLEAFRQMKDSGIDPNQVEVDAAPQDETLDVQDDVDTQDVLEESVSDDTDIDTDEPIDIPESQKTAFQKALEREKRKARDSAQEEVKKEYETQLNPYKAFFDRLGMDPQKAMEALEQQNIQQEAQRLADYNGWDEQQTQMFMRQQELERKQLSTDVSLRVYELADTPDYPGIKAMKGPITEFVRSNPRATVEQAYWAVGGSSLAQQMKREAEQREVAKRTQTKRTVITDAPTNLKGPEPLSPEAVTFMRRTGLDEEQVRLMMKDEGPATLDDYRKMKRKV